MSIKIIIADDHAMFAESLAFNLKHHGEFEVVRLVTDGVSLIEAYNFQKPDIVLMDYNMPEMNGLETVKSLRSSHPDALVLMITMHSGISVIQQLIRAGVKGIVLKNASTSEVVQAIKYILAGNTFYSQEIIGNLTKHFNTFIQLTKREKELIQLLREGLSTKQIAEKLFVSTHTVESHRKNLLAKTDTHNTQAMLKKIEEEGLL